MKFIVMVTIVEIQKKYLYLRCAKENIGLVNAEFANIPNRTIAIVNAPGMVPIFFMSPILYLETITKKNWV